MEILRTAFEEVRGGSTRVVALVAESGFGKTRLAQEFYGWLSTVHDGIGGEGYWPDKLLRRENNLQVNPALDECGDDGKRMPFLWWGLRISDPGSRNQGLEDALRHGVDVLKAHLEAYAREVELDALRRRSLLSGKGVGVDMAWSIAETLIGEFANAGTFGLLGMGKQAIEEVRTQRGILRDIEQLEDADASPAATERRRRDLLTETILADLHRIAMAPPEGFSSVPLVILVDDVQWLSADPGMASFLPALLQWAREEGWPLLLILTSWRAEWRSSATVGKAPGAFATSEDVVHELGRAEGLEATIEVSFPGLTDDQRAALTRKADGNPRLLDEMLMFLERRPKLFVDRDPGRELAARGLAETLTRDFAGFVADRLEEAPIHVRRALAIASLQGVAFSPRLVRRVAEGLKVVDVETGLKEGDDPHSFVTIGDEGEFRLGPYRDAAREDLENHHDEAETERALAQGLKEAATSVSEADEIELILAFEGAMLLPTDGPESSLLLVAIASELIRRANSNENRMTSRSLARKLMMMLASEFADGHTHDLHFQRKIFEEIAKPLRAAAQVRRTQEAQRNLAQVLNDISDVMQALDDLDTALRFRKEAVEALRTFVEAQPTLGAQRELADVLGSLGDMVDALDGPASVRLLREEEAAIRRVLAEAQPTPESQRDLVNTLSTLADLVSRLDGPAASLPLRREQAATFRLLAESESSPSAWRELAAAIGRLSNAIEVVDGPAAGRPLREEAVWILRSMAETQHDPEAPRDLAYALRALAAVVEALDSPVAARALREEETAIFSALAEAQPTQGARRELSVALGRLGDVVEALDGPDAARPLREQETEIHRALTEAQPSPSARHELAVALGRLGDVVEALDGPAAARPLREEETAIHRALVEARPTLAVRRDLAVALGRLGDVAQALDGPAAARPLREEETVIHRTLAEAQPIPGARRDLAIALARLGDVVQALGGPAAARPLCEEATAICRALAEAQPTPGARGELAIALARLGDVVQALDGPAAARPLREEATAICRALAEAQPTPGARRDLAIALGRLGDVVQALDGPAAARPLFEEATSICRALAEAQPTPQAALDLVGAIDKLAGSVFSLEGPAQSASLRREAVELAAMAHAALQTASSRLWLRGLEYRRLTDGLVGDAPWVRAFSLEAAAGADEELALRLETLSEAFRDWETRYSQVGSGWPEIVAADIARCQLGLGDPVAAASLGAATLAALHEIASLQPQSLGPKAVDAAIVLGLAQMRLGQSAEAMQTFEQAERDYASILRSSALGLRQSAAIAWFKAELLAELGRKNDAMAILKEGHAAAVGFARFGMMDGAAILKAFETRLYDR
ncbi:hypothetical protein [uncultured Albimonas sp.]|uniref:hypothetical protein n=1 Tax=uncultured Albimonas sp. TaxID=1331701 RepID=UPI0030ED0CB4